MGTELRRLPEIDQLASWAAAMNAWLDHHELSSIHTRKLYEAAWRRFVGCVPKWPWEIGQADVETFVKALTEEGKARRTINVYVAAISGFYTYCMELDPPLAVRNPTRGVRRQKVRGRAGLDWITPAELEQVIDAIPTQGQENLRDRALLMAMFLMGLRNTAVRTIRLCDLERRAGGAIYVTYYSKGLQDTRRYPADAWKYLEPYLEVRNVLSRLHKFWQGKLELGASDYVFVGHPSNAQWISEGKPLSASALRVIVEQRTAPVIGRRLKPHAFRHGVARSLRMAGRDVVEIKDFLRHESLNTTYEYLQELMADELDVSQVVLQGLGL
jgi:site-specific recombinase XerD